MKPPAFQFYPDDFLAGTVTFNNSQRGLYITMLCLQWSQGGVTLKSSRELSRGMPEDRFLDVVGKFDDDGTGMLRNQRLESERVKQSDFRKKCSDAGLRSAQGRLKVPSRSVKGGGVGTPQGTPQPKGNSPSPSPELNTNTLATPTNQGSLDLPDVGAVAPRKRARNKVFDCICEVCSSNPDEAIAIAKSGSLIGGVEKMVRSIHKIDDDRLCEEIRKRAKAYRVRFKDCALTPSALEKHWPSLGVAISQLSQDKILGLKTQIRSLRGYNTSDPKERAGYESQAIALIAELAASGEVYP